MLTFSDYQLRSAHAAKHVWVAVITMIEDFCTTPPPCKHLVIDEPIGKNIKSRIIYPPTSPITIGT